MPIIRLPVPGEVPVAMLATTETPLAAEDTPAIGTSSYAARADHVHPKQEIDLSDKLSIINPQPAGTASPGMSLNAAREDHVHQAQYIPTISPFAETMLDDVDARSVRTTIGALGDYNKNSIEFGDTAAAGSRVIKFHSSGNAIDYDSRILANGGTTVNGAGQLEHYAAKHIFGMGPIVPDAYYGITGSLGTGNAQAGSIGEFITVRYTLTGLTNNTVVSVTGLTITPGDWDLSASFLIQGGTDAGSTNTLYLCQAFMSGFNDRWLVSGPFSSVPANTPILAGCIPRYRRIVTANTPISLQLYASYTAGWFASVGEIQARRVR